MPQTNQFRSIQVDYVWQHFCLHYDTSNITKTDFKNSSFQNDSSAFFESGKMIPASTTSKFWKKKELPILFRTNNHQDWYSIENSEVQFNYDLIGSIFFFLSGWQEEHCTHFDHYGRFPYKGSIQEQLGCVTTAIVDHYLAIIREALSTHLKVEINSLRNSQLFITHDIDFLNAGWKEEGFHQLKKGKIWSTASIIFKHLLGQDHWKNLLQLIDYETSNNWKASYYFIPTQSPYKGIANADYDCQSRYIQQVFSKLNEVEFETALHKPLSEKEFSTSLLQDYLKHLPNNTVGNRHHFLRLKQEEVNIFNETEIRYDSSLGFAEHIGFRHGTASPFYLYDFKKKKIGTTLEIPLIIMDRTLRSPAYMNLNCDEAKLEILKVIKESQSVNGTLTILWHNNFFFSYKYADWQSLFEYTVKESLSLGASCTTGREILNAHK